jgi:DNA-binding NarL/FixJ family response regulator
MKQAVMIIDDHTIMRDGIKAIIRHDDMFEVVAEAGTMAEAIQLCRALKPTIVIMDLHLGNVSGIDVTTDILRIHPDTRVVILSMADDENAVMGALRAGVRGFVVKTGSDTDLLRALREISAGRVFFSPSISHRVLNRIRSGKDAASEHDALSPKEEHLLRLVAEGKTNKDISRLLNVGVPMVNKYRKTLMNKLGVNNTAGLTQVAVRLGLI